VRTADSGTLGIRQNEIHLWITAPDRLREPGLLERYRQLLSADETRRQQRFLAERDRHSALVTRAFLRDLLSAYAAVAPQDWRFETGPRGKPELAGAPLPLRFNLSHTTGLIACAVTLVDDIGCDVEYVARRSDTSAVAAEHFSQAELDEMSGLPASARRSRFFDYWTLKESYIKACGQGIYGIPLKDFSFRIGPPAAPGKNDNIRLSFAPAIGDDPALWQSWLFYPGLEHRIAISVRRSQAARPRYALRYFHSAPLQGRRELYW